MLSTSSPSPSSMLVDPCYAWRSTEVDIVMMDAATRSRLQTPPLGTARPLKRAHSPTASPRSSSPLPSQGPNKKVKHLPLPRTSFSPKRARSESIAERQSTPAPSSAPVSSSKTKTFPAKPLLHRLTQTVTPLTTIEPLGLELEKVFAVGVGHGLGNYRRVREGSRLGRVTELEDMEWE